MDKNPPEQIAWEVRAPLVYGSRHEGFFDNETCAREFAERLSEEKYGNSGLHISTKSRAIYVLEEEN